MAASDIHSHIPSDNPLSQENFDKVMSKAEKFWEHHKLGEIVDKDDFSKGALIFYDLEGVREFEYSSSNHTAEQRMGYSRYQQHLSELSNRQKTSLRWFGRRTNYLEEHDTDSVVKRLFFAVGDAVVNALGKKAEGNYDKSFWDHMKTFSRAQWQIFCTCFLAAMTQGWDQSSMNGANIAWPAPEQLNVNINSDFGINVFGWLNAAPFFIGAVVGSLLTDPLINAGLGRRWAIALGGFFSLIPVILTFGLESPRWLLKKNRYKEALTALILLYQLPSPIIACGELYMIFRRLEAEENQYLKELKNKGASNNGKTRSADGGTEMQEIGHVNTTALEEQNGCSRRAYAQSQDDDAVEAQKTSSRSSSRLRNGITAAQSSTREDQHAESSQPVGPSEYGRQNDDAPLELKDTSLSKRIKLLWHIHHIRR
ncbi:hypothetical protein N0V90_003557 [Kalmusia sp. IMI 367209]|nr:hypothetical protein N0V90_003557 [Kalmusia sp. IMI 367209]